MRPAIALIGALMLAGPVQTAAAQTGAQCASCRAVAHFRTCTQPMDGSAVLQGTVIRVENGPCSEILVLDVLRAPKLTAPPRIEVDLGMCATWAGKLGDLIQVAVRETPASDNSKHSLACRLW
jgi:hypothetical protein